VLLIFGGQTALNVGIELDRHSLADSDYLSSQSMFAASNLPFHLFVLSAFAACIYLLLNYCNSLRRGIFIKHGVRVLGTSVNSINTTEDRALFNEVGFFFTITTTTTTYYYYY
jgi:hypothetical protein